MLTANQPERFFTVTLSESQHQLIEQALRDLSAGDEDSERENEATLAAFLGSTEEVR